MTSGQLLAITTPLVIVVGLIVVLGLLGGGPPSLERFDHMTDDARQFLTTFCSSFPTAVVTFADQPEDSFHLTPAAAGSAPVSVSVADGDPIVVVSIGLPEDEVILEWMAPPDQA